MQSIQFWSLATLMVLATTSMLVVPLYWREQRLPATTAWRRWEPLALAAIVPLAAVSLYHFIGSPQAIDAPRTMGPTDDVAALHASAARRGNREAGDLDEAIARLQTRLAANPDDASGWRLLAQAYEFQGRTAEAATALARASLPSASEPASPALATGTLADGAFVQSAQEARRRRDFPAAIAAFAELARREVMTADLWADYADALGGARGRLDDQAASCIDAALRLDPRHVKALWLRASLQTQRRDHRAALSTWQTLAQLLPADSPDARIIADNLEEARANAARAAPSSSTGARAEAATLHGNVRLDPRWQAKVTASSVLFVYARAADERGPPLAVWRTQAGRWPVRFALGDADAMVPGRRLSDFRRVILEARVSRSGNALPQPGDLRAVSGVLDPRSAPEQQLIIAEEVGADVQGG